MSVGVNGSAARQLAATLEAYRTEASGRWDGCYLDSRTALALDYIHAHLFEEGLDVAGVCEACRLRNHNFTMEFKSVVGVGIRRYIELLRIEIAGRLIQTQRHSVCDIAMAVGYVHPETFSRAFRRVTGRTARQVRADDAGPAINAAQRLRIRDPKPKFGA